MEGDKGGAAKDRDEKGRKEKEKEQKKNSEMCKVLLTSCEQLMTITLKLENSDGGTSAGGAGAGGAGDSLNRSGSRSSSGVDLDVSIPALQCYLDSQSLQQLFKVLDAYMCPSGTIAAAAADGARARGSSGLPNGARAREASELPTALSASAFFQDVLSSDPTMRTLIWLERQERQHSSAAACSGTGGADSSNAGSADGIDLARIAHLMKQVRFRDRCTSSSIPKADFPLYG